MLADKMRLVAGTVQEPVDWDTFDGSNDTGPYTFQNDTAFSATVIPIDTGRILYLYIANPNDIYAVIGRLATDGSLSFGTPTLVLSTTASTTAVGAIINNSTAIIVWNENNTTVEGIVINFAGTAITNIGSAVSIKTTNTAAGGLAVCACDNGDIYVAYRVSTDSDRPYIRYLTVSGTTITVNNEFNYSTSAINYISLIALDNNRCLALTSHQSGVEEEAELFNIVSNTPNSLSTLSVKNAALTLNNNAMARITGSQVLAAYTDNFNGDTWALVITNTNDVLSKGTELKINTDSSEGIGIAVPDTSHGVIVNSLSETNINAIVVSIAGTTLTVVSTTTVLSGDAENVAACGVGQPFVVVAYSDGGDSNKGKSIVLTP